QRARLAVQAAEHSHHDRTTAAARAPADRRRLGGVGHTPINGRGDGVPTEGLGSAKSGLVQRPNDAEGMLFVKSLINNARVNDHQAHPIEELDTRTVASGGKAQLTRLHCFPIAAELIFAYAPGTCIKFGWFAAS